MNIVIDLNKEITEANGTSVVGATLGGFIGKVLGETANLKALPVIRAWDISRELATGNVLELAVDEFNLLKREIEAMGIALCVKAPAINILEEAVANASIEKTAKK